MSRKRHEMHKRAMGGGTKPVWNAGGEQNAAKEAEEKKRGGRVHMEGEGEKPKHRADKRARGGRMEHEKKEHEKRARGGAVPGRKRGGGIGANLTPLSTAATAPGPGMYEYLIH